MTRPLERWLQREPGVAPGPALAAAGIVAAADPASLGDPTAASAVLADRIAGEGAVPWRDPTGAPGWDQSTAPPPSRWAPLWDALDPPLPLRFSIEGDTADPLWVIDVLAGDGVWADGVFLETAASDRPAPLWRFPLRVGFLDDEAGRGLHRALAGAAAPGSWIDDLLDPMLIGAAGTTVELLVVPGPVEDASTAIRRARPPVAASLVVLTQRVTDGVAAAVSEMRDAAGAEAIAVAPVDDPADWIVALAREITHDRHIDVAFGSVRPSGGFIAGSPEFFSEQRTSRRAGALAQALRELTEGGRRAAADRSEETAVAADLEDLAGASDFAIGTGDASVMVEMERRAAPLVERAAADRRLQARITGEDEPERVLPGFHAGATYGIEVRIGPQEADWLSAAEAFPEQRLPPTQGPHRLTVVLTEPSLLERPQVGEIVLPAVGASTSCGFSLTTRPDTTTVDARLIVLSGNRVLQTARLPAAVTATTAGGGRGLLQTAGDIAETETVVRAASGSLSDRRPFDAAFVVNHGTDGSARATGVAGDLAAVVDLEDATVAGAIAKITGRLGEIVEMPEDFASLDAPGSVELLVFLAHHGRLLRDALASDFLGDVLAASRYLQVVSARPDAFLPFEFAYDFAAPGEDVALCPDAAAALENDDVTAECPGEHGRDVVCPFGFWAVTKVIERHAFQPGGDLPRGFLVRGQPTRDRRAIRLGPGAIFAASDRVDDFASGSTEAVQRTLRDVAGRVAVATSWEEWERDLRNGPAVLLLLPHTVYSETLDTFGLEIGHGERRWAAEIDDTFLPGDGRPVVTVLLGCETAVAGRVGYERFPALLRRAGAEVVVATLTEVLGRHAAPVAQELATLLYGCCRDGPVGFGEVMLRLRRRMLAGGKMMVLAVAAFGDADWLLAAENA